MHITFRQLETFLAFSKHLNFSQTAKSLHISQPAISKLIKQLEEQCDTALIERINHEIHLTAAGQLLVQHSRRVLHEMGLLKENILLISKQGHGKITLSIHNILQDAIFHILSTFYEKHPHIELEVIVDNRDNQLKQIENNEADLYLLGPIPYRPDLEQTHWITTEMLMVSSPQHPLAHQKKVASHELNGETIISSEESSTIFQSLETSLTKWDINYKSLRLNNSYAVKEAVRAGLGIGMLPELAVQHSLEKSDLKALNIAKLDVSIDFYIIHHKNKLLAPTTQSLKNFILNTPANKIK